MLKNSARILKKTVDFSIKIIKWFMQVKKIIAVILEIKRTHKYKLQRL
jgi:hypothetical protein